MIKAVINVDSPPPHVFNVLTDFSRYKEWIPGCQQCTVTSRSGNVTDADIIISSMKRIELALRFEAIPPNVLNFRMTRGKDIKAYSGTYRLMNAADGNGTVVIAELEIDAGFMVPKFMVDKISRKMMDDTGSALRKHIATLTIPTAIARASAQKAPEAKPRRARRILRIVKMPAGYNVWLLGQTFTIKSQGS
ncbi:MAG: SRPBCC family protein [Acidobacteria bacterium]|nr:SRPBCC family protein [Acidobacteriota bacterium]